MSSAPGHTLADWLDTDEHREQSFRLHQQITDREGPYVAAAWLVGMNPHLGDDSPLHAIRNGHSADARAATYAQINGDHASYSPDLIEGKCNQ